MTSIINTVLGYTEGRPIVGDLWIQESLAPTIVFVHGFKGFKDWGAWNTMAEFFYSRGFNFVKFNLSHNGGTQEQVLDFPDLEAFGQNNFSLELEDIEKVLEYLLKKDVLGHSIDFKRIALIGHSRGGTLAMLSALDHSRISALCTLNAVVDIKEWMYRFDQEKWKDEGVIIIPNARTDQDMPLYYQFMEDFLANISKYDLKVRCQDIVIPTMIIHCKDDPVVSQDQALLAHEKISESHLTVIESGAHTLGARHPWEEEELPASLRVACDSILRFFKDLDWISG